MIACWVLVGVFGTVVLLYALIEVHYFLRMFLTVLLARFCKKPVHILDETTVYGLCTTTDLDTLLYHMNNSRYLRELDFARADFYERTSLYREICSQGKGVVQGAVTIRYRRFLKPLSLFKIKSKTHVRPEMPLEVAKWLESNDISSAILRGTETSSVVTAT
ncbi:hypothetical protein G9C98_006550 [Cotesia typhae]|uniref:Protein THEM6 n=1 Tax=Cotesia typhae TaxID=2053667 RepID=A0A8J5VA56_9HYME|nr:hypothetical protein G9C98_006550 [Cotesia typhae]